LAFLCDPQESESPATGAGLIASIVLQEKHTLRPQSTAVYSGAYGQQSILHNDMAQVERVPSNLV
jgi:hypothetical protein